ncbi:hypothetical protein ACIGDI_39420 [Streptomyces sp. NPDC085900]|uniref:hypothetical protein n=1 Tax=Streptomyces sp. NPDC085900 TaxID=3365737 RepID=UPI0037D93B31
MTYAEYDRFLQAVQRLHRLAGQPKADKIARVVRAGPNPMEVNANTVAGWVRGTSVPRSEEQFLAVVDALVHLAQQRGRVVSVDLFHHDAWKRRIKEARGNRSQPPPPSPPTPPSIEQSAPGNTVRQADAASWYTRKNVIALLGAAAVVAGVGTFLLLDTLNGGSSTNDAKPTTSPSAGATASQSLRAKSDEDDKGPLRLTARWPTYAICDGATSVAMPSGGPDLSTFKLTDQRFRSDITSNKGAAWGAGHLYIDLSTDDGKKIQIDDIAPTTRAPKPIGPPAWVAVTGGGCGETYGRVFDYNLDTAHFADKGVVGQRSSEDSPAPTNPLGPGFTVSADDPATVLVNATACRGNYEWSLRITYTSGNTTHHKVVGPFRSMGKAGKNTVGYELPPGAADPGPSGPAPDRAVGCPVTT